MLDPLVDPMDLPWETWVSFVLACLSGLTTLYLRLKKEMGITATFFQLAALIGVLALVLLPLSEQIIVVGYFVVAIAFLLGLLVASISEVDNMGRRFGQSLIFLVGAFFSLALGLRPLLYASEISALLFIERIMWILTLKTTLVWIIVVISTSYHRKKA